MFMKLKMQPMLCMDCIFNFIVSTAVGTTCIIAAITFGIKCICAIFGTLCCRGLNGFVPLPPEYQFIHDKCDCAADNYKYKAERYKRGNVIWKVFFGNKVPEEYRKGYPYQPEGVEQNYFNNILFIHII